MSTERNKLIPDKEDINNSGSYNRSRGGEGNKNKKKWFIIGGIIAAVVIVAIVLGVTLGGKKSDPSPQPGPGPEPGPKPDPPTPMNYVNPY